MRWICRSYVSRVQPQGILPDICVLFKSCGVDVNSLPSILFYCNLEHQQHKLSYALRLKRFRLGFCGRGLGDNCGQILGGSCSLRKLADLSLDGAYRLTDEGLTSILESTSNLKSLSLQQSSRLSGDFLKVLPVCLKSLDLSECRGISGEALIDNLPSLVGLDSLTLDGIQEVIYNTGLCFKTKGVENPSSSSID